MKVRHLLAVRRDPSWLICITSMWLATASNLPLWHQLNDLSPIGSLKGIVFAIAMAILIAAALVMVSTVFAWRWTLKPFLTLLLVAGAFGAHFMSSYGIVIDPTMLTNVAQTDVSEVTSLLSLKLLVTVSLLGILPALFVWVSPIHFRRWPVRLAQNVALTAIAGAVLVFAALSSYQTLSSTMRNHKQVRYLINPLNSLYAVGRVVLDPLQRKQSNVVPIGQDARIAAPTRGERPPLLILVVGETGRSGNFGLNGYARDTTPELAKQNVASFRNVWSCGTSTAASLPCMFSHLGKDAFESRERNYEGLLDVLQRAGLAVLWIDNQAGCKGVCARVPSSSTSDSEHSGSCSTGGCDDSVMLKGLDARIAAVPNDRRERGIVLVMHQMGSHGPAYSKRSPESFKRFNPECKSVNLQDCSRTDVVNAYDNSIAFTDHFLASTITWLKTKQDAFDAAMVYVADHGESLGERNIYLHGLPYAFAPDVQKRVPWITWLSKAYEERSHITTQCLQNQRDMRITHDNYFHSVIGLLGVRTDIFNPRLNVYGSCVGGEVSAR